MADERCYFEYLRDITFSKARESGYEVVIPTADQLQLDIDKTWPFPEPAINGKRGLHAIHHGNARSIEVLRRFQDEFTIARTEAWKSAGGNCHVVLTLAHNLELAQRIALQAILGSDPMRELLNLRRVLCSADDPVALFRPPYSDTDKETANG